MAVERGVIPWAPEEDWQRRLAKREGIIARTKAWPWYTGYGGPRVLTPDPRDRAVSKRAWEKQVQVWRNTLKMWQMQQMDP